MASQIKGERCEDETLKVSLFEGASMRVSGRKKTHEREGLFFPLLFLSAVEQSKSGCGVETATQVLKKLRGGRKLTQRCRIRTSSRRADDDCTHFHLSDDLQLPIITCFFRVNFRFYLWRSTVVCPAPPNNVICLYFPP